MESEGEEFDLRKLAMKDERYFVAVRDLKSAGAKERQRPVCYSWDKFTVAINADWFAK